MSYTRNIIQEIQDIRQRRRYGSAMFELPQRLFTLEDSFRKHDKSESELIRYFPVALIACIEGYFRMVIKDLIDTGDPFLSNAEKLGSPVKIDFSVLKAVRGKITTVGELVAHGVKISSLEQIEAALSKLLGTGFLQGLRNTKNRYAHEIGGEPEAPILSMPDEVFANVTRTFELRHIICHEIASAYEIQSHEVERCFESCVTFLLAVDEFISETIHPGAPLTQADMNITAANTLSEKRERLDEIIEALRRRLDVGELIAFDSSQAKWQLYCDAWADFVAGDRESNGTIWPLIYAGAAEAVIGLRIEEVGRYRGLGDDEL